MRWTRKLSLRHKITLVIMINTFVALCVAGTAFAEYGVYRFKELRLEDLNARFPGRFEPAELLLEMARRRQVFYPDERS